MPWLKWLPWRFFIRRIARAHGFLDPIALLARLHRFAQPSAAPAIEVRLPGFLPLSVPAGTTSVELEKARP